MLTTRPSLPPILPLEQRMGSRSQPSAPQGLNPWWWVKHSLQIFCSLVPPDLRSRFLQMCPYSPRTRSTWEKCGKPEDNEALPQASCSGIILFNHQLTKDREPQGFRTMSRFQSLTFKALHDPIPHISLAFSSDFSIAIFL